jgi:putative transposase
VWPDATEGGGWGGGWYEAVRATTSFGDAYDSAMCESFFATLETELIERKSFRNQAEARMAGFDFIEAWYNPHRRHSSLGQLSHLSYEREHTPPA